MLRVRFGTARLLAVLLPANLLWVFLACTLQCGWAAEAACHEREGSDDCCATGAKASCEAVELTPGPERCSIVVVRAVLPTGEPRACMVPLGAPAVAAIHLVGDARDTGVVMRRAHAPPRARPLDRLPALRI